MNKLEYIKDLSTGIETISYEKVNIAYPEHTHIGHFVFGIVTDGTVGVPVRLPCGVFPFLTIKK